MKLTNSKQVFNLMNTNGRRADVINAYTIYMEILNELFEENGEVNFTSYPESWNQFRFYEEAIKRSSDVFTKHPKYDNFVEHLEKTEYAEAFESMDIDEIKDMAEGNKLLKDLDQGIEMRARHYTSNLNKIGFATKDKEITPVGKSFVEGKTIERDSFENLLPINDTNLIFLRQLLKLRVYNSDCTLYYSPMLMCLYILSRNETIEVETLLTAVQLITPEHYINPETFLDKIEQYDVETMEKDYISYDDSEEYREIRGQETPMNRDYFESKFKNRKSSKVSEYYDFYYAWINFMEKPTQQNLTNLYEIWKNGKDKINKAFSLGKNTFNFDNRNPTNVELFLELNADNPYLNVNNYNGFIYDMFNRSKRHDQVKENSDTLLRLLTVTGIITTKNGIAGLEYRETWKSLFENINLANHIFVKTTEKEYRNYELSKNPDFHNHKSIENIFGISKESVSSIIITIQNKLNTSTIDETQLKLKNQIENKFKSFIEDNYPKETVIEILNLFSDRSNDNEIQERTNSEASVPTIFEYIVGIAWYHISDEDYDVFSSFNLTMNADFIPETHAGGGEGDIIARYSDKVIMLEATLMNKQAQKRGEWEPVLRHATNLTIEEEPKPVHTLFIADELDENTINIWRAVASVPLKSSKLATYENDYAQRVTIMPLKNNEVTDILEKSIRSYELIQSIDNSFSNLSIDFNLDWRKQILTNFNV